MGKQYKEQHLVDLNIKYVEEDRHSDSGSLEEISEDAFNAAKSRVQKSSINSIVKDSDNQRGSVGELSMNVDMGNDMVVDMDIDSDMGNDMVVDMDIDSDEETDIDEVRCDSRVMHMKKQVDTIKEELGRMNVDDGDVSYDSLCLRLEKTSRTLHAMIIKDGDVPEKEALVQLVLSKILKLLSSHGLKEENKDVLARLTSHAKRKPPLFSYSQLKEIRIAMFASWNKSADSSIDSIDITRKQTTVEHANNKSTENPTNGEMEHIRTTIISNQPEDRFLEENEKSVPSPQTLVLPLLELHSHRDADNFPSPTREISVPLPSGKGFSSDCLVTEPERHAPLQGREENMLMLSCETDVARAVSSDLQKLERSEFLTSERLPSPTSIEEGDIADGGVDGQVSSCIVQDNAVVNGSIPKQTLVSSASDKDLLTTEEETGIHGPTIVPASVSQKTAPKAKLVAERDINLNISSRASELSSESHDGVKSMQQAKMSDEDLSDPPAVKRQRNESTSDGDACYLRTDGSFGDNGTVAIDTENTELGVGCVSTGIDIPHAIAHDPTIEKLGVACVSTGINTHDGITLDPNITEPGVACVSISINTPDAQPRSHNEPQCMDQSTGMIQPTSCLSTLPVASQSVKQPVEEFNAALSLSSLVRDIVVNPSMWIDILKAEHAKKGTLKEDSVKVRMNSLDPRRKLYDGALVKGVNRGPDQSKSAKPFSRIATLVNLNAIEEDGESNKKLGSSSSAKLPDIAIQFTETASAEAVTAPLRPKNANAWADFHQLLGAFDDEQKALIQRERAKRVEEQRKMFAHRKLSLVLDLDHTLLNSAMFADVNPQQNEILRKKEVQDRQNPPRHLFRLPHMRMWTKLRPGIWNFLEKASKLYELHVCTMGNKSYATEMAKLLDPNGELFAGKVFSRGDDCAPFDGGDRLYRTKDLEGVLGLETNVVIIDDTVRVWPHNKPNLIAVERYTYFPCSRRQFGLQGPSLLEIDHDERPEDGTLSSCLAVLERIHGGFFAHKSLDEADARDILASEKRKILSGCRIVFSRVFPVREANPHMHPLWKTAEEFGAVCTNCVDERVVAISLGTEKVNWAQSSGRFVVHPGWVEASALLYRRANESDFAVK